MIDDLIFEYEKSGLPFLIERVVQNTGYGDYLHQDDDRSEERLENIEEFKAASEEFTDDNSVQPLIDFLESVALVSDTDKLDDNSALVTLITLHQAKGLEYPVVFMVGMVLRYFSFQKINLVGKEIDIPDLPSFSTGDKVRHPKFGVGLVTGTKPAGVDLEVTVAFGENQGIKRLLLSFANLEKVD